MAVCRSVQPTRRAVLHIQPAGDPSTPPDLVEWFTARGFHFYSTAVPLPSDSVLGRLLTARHLKVARADLELARAHLVDAEGIASIIVTAVGRAAIATALWLNRREFTADALILHDPALPPAGHLRVDIGCPVLVLSESHADGTVPRRGWSGRRGLSRGGGQGNAGLQLGAHVTLLRLAGGASMPQSSGRQQYFDEVGRWLGAYMYGGLQDQLL